MLSRFICPSSRLRFLTLILSSSNPSLSSSSPSPSSSSSSYSNFRLNNPNLKSLFEFSKTFSTDRNNGDDSRKDPSISRSWNFSPENGNDDDADSLFGADGGDLSGIADEETVKSETEISTVGSDNESWDPKEKGEDVFADIDREFGSKDSGGGEEWETVEGYKPWSFGDEEKEEVFDIGGVERVSSVEEDKGLDMETETETSEADLQLVKEEEELSATLKGIDFENSMCF